MVASDPDICNPGDFSVRYWSAESLGLLGEPAVVYVKAFAVIALFLGCSCLKGRRPLLQPELKLNVNLHEPRFETFS
jgi:hypothetical protein